MDSTSFSDSDQVMLGNGQGLPIQSIGSAYFNSTHTPHTTLTLKNLLLVPSITKNLISVSQFAKDNHVYFEFHADKCFVKTQGTSKVLLQGSVGPNGLYSFGALQPISPGSIHSISPSVHTLTNLNSLPLNSYANNTATSLGTTTYSLWHNRLGHPHYEALKVALTACNTSIPIQSKLDFCASCCLGKIHRLPSTASTAIYHAPFDLNFADVWDPAPMLSTSGYKYLFTCVDAYTRYTWVFPLKLKSDVCTTLTHFITLIKTQFGIVFKSMQTDGGGEFQSLKSFFTHPSSKWFS
jgi:histone deacetylase 1/2